ncbi:MAG: hypothetical protein ABR981_06035 [Candidatus Micrarchaeaceae archaeon]|jgi:hypothetical protein
MQATQTASKDTYGSMLLFERMHKARELVNTIGRSNFSDKTFDMVSIDYSENYVEGLYKITGKNPKIRLSVFINPEVNNGGLTNMDLIRCFMDRPTLGLTTGENFIFQLGIAYETRHMEITPGTYVGMEAHIGNTRQISAHVEECIGHVLKFSSQIEEYEKFLRRPTLPAILDVVRLQRLIFNVPNFVHRE